MDLLRANVAFRGHHVGIGGPPIELKGSYVNLKGHSEYTKSRRDTVRILRYINTRSRRGHSLQIRGRSRRS